MSEPQSDQDERREPISWLSDEIAEPVNTRAITMSCYPDGDLLEVVGRLTDTRSQATQLGPDGIMHDMELRLKVDRSDFTIIAVRAQLFAHPHEDCRDIEGAFQQLVGLSVMRGYTKNVQELLGRERGCSHLEFLARAMGPVVIQGATSLAAQARLEAGDVDADHVPGPWMKNTCHIWAENGPAEVKLKLGWRPGSIYPVPRVEKLREILSETDGD